MLLLLLTQLFGQIGDGFKVLPLPQAEQFVVIHHK
jgi:hypothetical protein